MNFIKKQLLRNRWLENPALGEYELLRRNSQAKQGLVMGMRLAVLDEQAAAIIAEGKLITVFLPGAYQLAEDKIPNLARAKDCDWLYPAELYFLNLAAFRDCPFSNTAPLLLRDPDLGLQQLQLKGSFEMQIINAPTFLNEMVLGAEINCWENLNDYLINLLSETIIGATIARPCPLAELKQLQTDLEHDIFKQVNALIRPKGFQLNRLDIESLTTL